MQFHFINRLTLSIVALGFGIASTAEAASTYLSTFGINHLNPSDMSTTGTYQLYIGGDAYTSRYNQTNLTIDGIPGSAVSSHMNVIPYFRFAYRLNPKWVLGFDFTHPFWSEVNFGLNSFVNPEAVVTRLHSFDLSPRMSYQINPYISVGLGLDAMHITSTELSNQTPTDGPLFTSIENGRSWTYGWDGGVTINITKNTIASFSVFSQMTSTIQGESNYSNLHSPDTSFYYKTPTTFILRLTQNITPTWMVQFLGAYDEQWVVDRYPFHNTAIGDYTLPANNANSFVLQLLTSYGINSYWSILLGGAYEDNPQPTATNFIGLPVGNNWAVFLGPTVKLSKVASLQAFYAYSFEHSSLHYLSAVAGPVSGNAHTNFNTVDIQLSFAA